MSQSTRATPNPSTNVGPAAPIVPPARMPRHIAIIMDGNGRWAQRRNLPRIAGHEAGAVAVRDTVTECAKLQLGVLTLYSFSMENWKRPKDEVGALMMLAHEYLIKERDELLQHNIRFRQIGRREGLPDDVLREIDATVAATAECTGLQLCLAMNYGSRAEITDAVRAIAAKVEQGTLQSGDISESLISDHLYTRGLPDPDLLIRTAGEHRLSNYLLWQSSYAELHVTDVLWPDFRAADLHTAIRDFASRERRFGGLIDPPPC